MQEGGGDGGKEREESIVVASSSIHALISGILADGPSLLLLPILNDTLRCSVPCLPSIDSARLASSSSNRHTAALNRRPAFFGISVVMTIK